MIGPKRLLRKLLGERRSEKPRARPTAVSEPEPSDRSVIQAPDIGPGRLFPDLLPEKVWGSNLRGILTRAEWDCLRIPVCESAGNVCEVCGSPGFDPQSGRPRRPDCHELWSFEIHGDRFVQRLARLIALDPDCHRVQHIGFAGIKDEMHLVRSKLAEVNGWNPAQVQAALDDAVEIYDRRATFSWDLDLSRLHDQIQIENFPSLLVPAPARNQLGNSYFNRK